MKRYLMYLMVLTLVLLPAITSYAKKTKEPYKIGVIHPLTGPLAMKTCVQAMEMVVEEVNAKGGINGHPVKLFVEDSEIKTERGVAAATKLIEREKVIAIVGPWFTNVAIGVIPVTEKAKIVLFSHLTSNPRLHERGPNYFFRMSPDDIMASKALARHVASEYGAKLKLGVFHGVNPWEIGGKKAMEDALKVYEIVPIAAVPITSGSASFVPELMRLRAAGVEAIFPSCNQGDQIRMGANLKEMGWDVKVFSLFPMGNPKIHIASRGALDGTYFVDTIDSNNPKTMAWRAKFEKKYDTMWDGNIDAHSYETMRIVMEVLKKSGADREKFREALEGIKNFKLEVIGAPGCVASFSRTNHHGLSEAPDAFAISRWVPGKPGVRQTIWVGKR